MASVSCIYGLGAPETYFAMSFRLNVGMELGRKALLEKLVSTQYTRTDGELKRGEFRVRGDLIDIYPAYEDIAFRFELEDGRLKSIEKIDPLLDRKLGKFEEVLIHPRTFFSAPEEDMRRAATTIEEELVERLAFLRDKGLYVEAERIEERTLYDLEMLREFGYCQGIENYSRHLTGRKPGEPPYTLLDYFPKDFLTIIDESHVTVPQIGGMYQGDRSRKMNLIEHGFRLPSALDNRPLEFREFESRVGQILYVSATPGAYELKKAEGRVVEQIIRPTGLTDPEVEIRPVRGQVDDLMGEIRKRAAAGERVLITTLTKKMAEELTSYYHDLGVRYLHSEVETLDRVKLLRDLRKGKFDALVGINLLREGLDLPEVSLVAILDADKEGFLRSATALIQTFGRAARNIDGRVILYADNMTDSMKSAIGETGRRRGIQEEYNLAHGITPKSIVKSIDEGMTGVYDRDYIDYTKIAEDKDIFLSPQKRKKRMDELEKLMKEAAKALEFEKAAGYRDELTRLRKGELELTAD